VLSNQYIPSLSTLRSFSFLIYQDECLREESRYHYLQHLIGITKIKIDRAEQEKAWQKGKGRMMRDFAHLKEFYQVMCCIVYICCIRHGTGVSECSKHPSKQCILTLETYTLICCGSCVCFAQNKLTQQEHLTKQLRSKQKELKENSGARTNQKSNFLVSFDYLCLLLFPFVITFKSFSNQLTLPFFCTKINTSLALCLLHSTCKHCCR